MTDGPELSEEQATTIIESLRMGVPPKRFISAYSVGHDRFLKGVRRRLLESASERGRIRFVSGSWGAGKTHFLRLLREAAFDSGYLVSTVELSADQTPFNKFEQVLFDVVRNITSVSMYEQGNLSGTAPFGTVLEQALRGAAEDDATNLHAAFEARREALMSDTTIDIDVRRLVSAYWETFLAGQEADTGALEDRRGALLQWFEGEGHATTIRKEFGIQKTVGRANARLILSSLVALVRHLGFRGLVVLLDEAEMSHSTMRKSNLRQAHNNLLALINGIEETAGALLVYAAVPEFFADDRIGIKVYGALAQRIGQPKEAAPRAVDRVWNIDHVATEQDGYEEAASRIRRLYLKAYPDVVDDIVDEDDFRRFVRDLVDEHPQFSPVSTWRVVVTGVVEQLDDMSDGVAMRSAEEVHGTLMDRLRDD
jgi:hypothetical protein